MAKGYAHTKALERQEIIRLRKMRWSTNKIAAHLGRSRDTTYRLAKKVDVKCRPQIDRTKVLKLRMMGLTMREIAVETGYSKSVIGRRIKEATPDQWLEAKQALYRDVRKAHKDGDPVSNIMAWSRLPDWQIRSIIKGAQPRFAKAA